MVANPYDIGWKKGKKIAGSPASPNKVRFGTLSKAIKTANKTPQAVARVIGFAKSAASAKNMVDYISRDGDLELTDQDEDTVQDDQERDDLLEDWNEAFPKRKDGRFAMHYMVSTPEGSDPKALEAAGIAFAAEVFAEYDFVMATHTDEPNPHNHYIVARRKDGPRLDPKKGELEAWREKWAEIGTEHGIPMVASRRIERGRGRKSKKARDIHIEKREGTTQNDRKAAAELLGEWGKDKDEPWNKALDDRLRAERAKYERLSKALDTLSKSAGDDAPKLDATAKLLRRQSMALRQVMTRRDIMKHLINDPEIPVSPKSSPKRLALAYANSDGYMSKILSPAAEKTVEGRVAGVEQTIAKTAMSGTPAATAFLKTLEREKDFGI